MLHTMGHHLRRTACRWPASSGLQIRGLHEGWAPSAPSLAQARATTILSVRKADKAVLIGDGQVTLGSSIVKPNATKVRRIGSEREVLVGFAGAAADSLTLVDMLEKNIEKSPGQVLRACIDLAQEWRKDKILRRLDAVLIVSAEELSLTLTGQGEVIEPYDGIIAIGSGSAYALGAARALMTVPDLDAEEIAERAMQVAADTCVYTNDNFTKEVLHIGGDRGD